LGWQPPSFALKHLATKPIASVSAGLLASSRWRATDQFDDAVTLTKLDALTSPASAPAPFLVATLIAETGCQRLACPVPAPSGQAMGAQKSIWESMSCLSFQFGHYMYLRRVHAFFPDAAGNPIAVRLVALAHLLHRDVILQAAQPVLFRQFKALLLFNAFLANFLALFG
jgi:hypothetical protein